MEKENEMIIFPIRQSNIQISGDLPAKYGVIFLLVFSPLHYFLWNNIFKMYARGNAGWGTITIGIIVSGLHVLLFQSLVRRVIRKRRKKIKKELKRLAKTK